MLSQRFEGGHETQFMQCGWAQLSHESARKGEGFGKEIVEVVKYLCSEGSAAANRDRA